MDSLKSHLNQAGHRLELAVFSILNAKSTMNAVMADELPENFHRKSNAATIQGVGKYLIHPLIGPLHFFRREMYVDVYGIHYVIHLE